MTHKITRVLLATVAVGALAFGSVACGDDDGGGTEDTTTTGTTGGEVSPETSPTS